MGNQTQDLWMIRWQSAGTNRTRMEWHSNRYDHYKRLDFLIAHTHTILWDGLVQVSYLDPAPQPVKQKGWVNIYSHNLGNAGDQVGCVHTTKEKADAYQRNYSPRIACIEIEFTEGEGL